MRKSIQIIQIIQNSIKETFPFLRFAFFWLFFTITPVWCYLFLLELPFSSLLLKLALAYAYILFVTFLWFITIPYLLHCFYKKQPPSSNQFFQHLKAHIFSIMTEILKLIVHIFPIFLSVLVILGIPIILFPSNISVIWISVGLLCLFLIIWTTILWTRFLFIPLIVAFNDSYQKGQIDTLEYSKILTKGYRGSIFICFSTINIFSNLLALFASYITYIFLSLFFNEESLPNIVIYQENNSLSFFILFTILFSYFLTPFFHIVYYKFYKFLEASLQDLDSRNLMKE